MIFDEASQIPVEEAVPALFRGAQVIVVGDQMQLPPTRYFQVGTHRPRDEPGRADDDDCRSGVVLDSDSFLAVGSVRLPSTMLTWHYRSQYEALIQFSNAAFYEGRLTTIPDRTLTHVRAGRWRSRPDRFVPGGRRRRRRRAARAQHQRDARARRRLHAAHQPAGGRLDRAPGPRAAGAGDGSDARHRRVLRGAAGRDRARAGAPGPRATPSSRGATTPRSRARRTASWSGCS